MLKYLIVREVRAYSDDLRKQMIVKLVLNREQYEQRLCDRIREILGDLYTVDIERGIKKGIKSINDDFESEKLDFA